jgi:FKBP-type peptidyl-prolyl cis-trans isomerase
VKLIGKLQDGTVFVKKGHEEEPFEFKVDEGDDYMLVRVILIYFSVVI